MANIRKSFNFRNGVQVDNDNFIVDPNGLVGIGTSIPTESLDLIGNVKISGFTTTTTLSVAQTSNFYSDVKVGSVNIDANSGAITATKFVGDASGLQNIVAISTTGWVAGVGLHTFRSIGIGTTNPEYHLQIGENPASGVGVGITDGGIVASGVITATTFKGIFDGNVIGDLTGIASTATKLETARDFSISGDVSSSTISFDGTNNVSLASTLSSSFSANTSGIITASKFVGPTESATSTITTGTITNANITNADVGIGTFDDLRIDKAAGASLVVTSTTNSSVSIGESVGAGNSSAQLLYVPGTGRLDINNYDVGGVSINLHEGTGAGTTESFNVNYDNIAQFEVTYDGKVGVNRGGATLTSNLEVGGTAYISGNSEIVGTLQVGTGVNQVTLGDGSALPISDSQNFNILSGISTFNELHVQDIQVGAGITVTSSLYAGSKVGVGTTSDSSFVVGEQDPIFQVFGTAYSTEGFISNELLGITTDTQGSLRSDPRTIPSDLGSTIPSLEYGNFQVDSGAASFISSNFLIVPTVGVTTVGFGSTNLGVISKYHHPDYGSQEEYMSSVGVNTYFARSILDVGTASTSMNSYFIPPSLTEDQVSVVSDLWQNPTGFGTITSKKVTPNGLVPGGLLYNSTRDKIQVRNTASSFRNLSPIVAFATIVSGGISTPADGYNLNAPTNSTNDADFLFSSALQSANYTVIVSNTGTSTFTVPEVNKTTAGFKITFSSSASAESYSVMILQV